MITTKTRVLISFELDYSAKNYGDKFNSYHEGYAVILEELDEVWEEIKKKEVDKEKLKKELTQVAAMAIKLMQQLE